MSLKIDTSPVNAGLSKMEVAIENIASFTATCNLAVNKLKECEVVVIATTKVTFTEEPKWTKVRAKSVCQVVNYVVESLVDTPKQEEHKFNLIVQVCNKRRPPSRVSRV
jgi:hypothetical protein